MLKILSDLWCSARHGRVWRETEALIAQELYEPLAPDEAARLQTLLKRFPELKEERESLRRTVAMVQLPEEELSWDLRSRIRAALDTEEAVRRPSRARAYALAASIMVVFTVGLYSLFMLSGDNGTTTMPRAAEPAPKGEANLAQFQQQACDLVAQGETEQAAELLERAIDTHPGDAQHAEALLTLADIEYAYLQRYDRAYDVYKRLELEHRDVFNRNWYHDKRVRLLSAALPDGFAPLRELEAAGHSKNPLTGYENILVEYPDTPWADEAMNQMGRMIARANDLDITNTVRVLEQVRDTCAHPVARDRVDLELGNYYCDSLDDLERARSHYVQAAESRHMGVAARAREALARLD